MAGNRITFGRVEMVGFLGTYQVNLDEKGRLNVPAKFKGLLDKQYDNHNLVVAVMPDKEGNKDREYLIVFPQKEWLVNEEKLSHLSGLDGDDRNKMREIYAQASECEVKSGKILIPQHQRDRAGLKKEVILVGMSKTFEIWSADRFEI
ncbi:Protein MraZ [Nitrospina gracilis 3/211]|uniref:Transcriptional regulator MraZ n=2 Tax=Nitrospinaceae TaxID=407032 RepID=M1YUV1_NITG3|nr:Protein MraZ [Nitrospina gracilis 3/211]